MKDLIEATKDVGFSYRELTKITIQINKLNIEHQKVLNKYGEDRKKFLKLLSYYDLKSDGNFGWENRFMNFISEITKENTL